MFRQDRFALNHRVAPRQSLPALFALANGLDIDKVEIRNDLAGTAIANGTPAEEVGRLAEAHGLTILSINALQRFNEWSAVRAQEAAALVDYAADCGARAVVMCPVNDEAFTPGEGDRLAMLREALERLAPMLRRAGVMGLVEPLGFAECSLRLKRDAVDAIDVTGTREVFRLVHDTFHHHVAGEREIFPARTGLVHVSGVDDPTVPTSSMRDPHRVLVGEGDRIDNIGQMQALEAGGYAGPYSFEPFAASVADLPDAHGPLAASLQFMSDMPSSRS